MESHHKIIGTLVPLSALYSKALGTDNETHGTFATGEVFIDWLQKTDQHAWQLLPLHETQLKKGSATEHILCPYKGYGIGLDHKYTPPHMKKTMPSSDELSSFLQKHHAWLPDYALFCALRDYSGTDNWTQWDKPLRKRSPQAIEQAQSDLRDAIHTYTIQQWQAHQAFALLQKKAEQAQIRLIGDMPFYLSLHSPLVWKLQDAFVINDDGTLPRVSGVIEEAHGRHARQIWGHPLYDWNDQEKKKSILDLFKLRLTYLKQIYDTIRLDHTNGFFLYGSIDPQNQANDVMKHGPGKEVLHEIITFTKQIHLNIYAEDIAMHAADLRAALQQFHVPGVRVLRYAYNTKSNTLSPIHAAVQSYPKHSFAYTSTHDTEPLMAFLENLTHEQKTLLLNALNIEMSNDTKTLAKRLRQLILTSPSDVVLVPIQDWLLTNERINTPGTEKEENDLNWRYRVQVPIEDLPTSIF